MSLLKCCHLTLKIRVRSYFTDGLLLSPHTPVFYNEICCSINMFHYLTEEGARTRTSRYDQAGILSENRGELDICISMALSMIRRTAPQMKVLRRSILLQVELCFLRKQNDKVVFEMLLVFEMHLGETRFST